MGTFDERIKFLSNAVGTGKLVGGVTVDQPYAQDQHENLSYKHFRGGRAHFLGGPLMENWIEYLNKLTRGAITEDGSALEGEMREIVEDMADESKANAPILTGDLKNSASPWVKDDATEVYRRPPMAPRDNSPESGWNR